MVIFIKITCDTPISAVISEKDIISEVRDLSSAIKPALDYSGILNEELQNGKGLNKQALSVEGKAVANERATEQLNDLAALEGSYVRIVDSMLASVREQRKEELTTLKTKVEDKISELESQRSGLDFKIREINNPSVVGNVLDSMFDCIPDKSELPKLRSEVTEVNKSIKEYKKKLTKVEEALKTVKSDIRKGE